MTSTVDLLAAIGAHLAEFELPPIASIHVAVAVSAPQVIVQLSCRAPSAIAQGLLAWADTLTAITAEVWRVPQGESVHLSVTGLLPGGPAVQIYGWRPDAGSGNAWRSAGTRSTWRVRAWRSAGGWCAR